MKVKLLHRIMNQGKIVEVGEEIELTDELAQHLVDDGVAVDPNEGLEVEVEVEETEKTANDYSRKELDAMAVDLGLDPKEFSNKNLLFDAIQEAQNEPAEQEDAEEENNTEDLGQEG